MQRGGEGEGRDETESDKSDVKHNAAWVLERTRAIPLPPPPLPLPLDYALRLARCEMLFLSGRASTRRRRRTGASRWPGLRKRLGLTVSPPEMRILAAPLPRGGAPAEGKP